MSITWEEMKIKYPEGRNTMSEEREKHMSMNVLIVMNKKDLQKNFGVLLVIIKNILDKVLK